MRLTTMAMGGNTRDVARGIGAVVVNVFFEKTKPIFVRKYFK